MVTIFASVTFIVYSNIWHYYNKILPNSFSNDEILFQNSRRVNRTERLLYARIEIWLNNNLLAYFSSHQSFDVTQHGNTPAATSFYFRPLTLIAIACPAPYWCTPSRGLSWSRKWPNRKTFASLVHIADGDTLGTSEVWPLSEGIQIELPKF